MRQSSKLFGVLGLFAAENAVLGGFVVPPRIMASPLPAFFVGGQRLVLVRARDV